jgi:PAS domain-containing protein
LRARPRRRRGNDGHALLDALLDSVTVPVLAFAADSRLTHANPAARELIGGDCLLGTYPEEWVAALEPRTASGIPMPSEDLPPLRALDGEVVRGVDVLVRIRDRDALLEVTARPAVSRRSRPRGAVVVLEEVTERRRRLNQVNDHRAQPARS